MAVELEHPFSTAKPIDESFATILDLERVVPCVEGGSVLERTGPDAVKAEIKIKMGAMSMTFTGTVEIVEQDAGAHRVVMSVKSREAGGQGTPTPPSRSRSTTAAGRSTPARRSRARPRRWARGHGRRARRADHGLLRQARGPLTAARRWPRSRCVRSAKARCLATAGPRSRRTPTGPSSRQRPRRLRLRRVRQPPRRGDAPWQMTKKVRVRWALLDRERVRDRRLRGPRASTRFQRGHQGGSQ